jgi:uncharacterized protein YndB with AHSA1/START domain
VSMSELRYETEIRCTAEAIFAAIVDLRGYDRWLTSSAAYGGTTEISTDPISAGTTYVESGPGGVRNGTVTEFEPPTRVTFHQPMTMKTKLLGVIDIKVRYLLTPTAASVHVVRLVTLAIPWPLMLIQPLVVRQFRKESERTVLALKAHAEALG